MRSKNATRALLAAAPLLLAVPASAQLTAPSTSIPELVEARAEEATTETITLRHVPAALMAWWIDPENQNEPLTVLEVDENSMAREAPGAMPGNRTDVLKSTVRGVGPKGRPAFGPGAVQLTQPGEPRVTLQPVEETGLLKVTGTSVQIRRVRRLVQLLDLPQRQVELQLDTVRLRSEGDLAALLQEPSSSKSLTSPRLAGNWGSRLREMEKSGRASLARSSRVTAINNLPASLVQTEKGHARLEWNGSVRHVPIESSLALVSTPTVNNDDTVTVSTKADHFLLLGQGPQRLPLQDTLRSRSTCATATQPSCQSPPQPPAATDSAARPGRARKASTTTCSCSPSASSAATAI